MTIQTDNALLVSVPILSKDHGFRFGMLSYKEFNGTIRTIIDATEIIEKTGGEYEVLGLASEITKGDMPQILVNEIMNGVYDNNLNPNTTLILKRK